MSIYSYLKAARLPSYLIIFLPLYIGYLISIVNYNKTHVTYYYIDLFIINIHGILSMISVLYINDYYDYNTDCKNKTYYISGGSRVLVNKLIQPNSLLNVAYYLFYIDICIISLYSTIYNLPYLLIVALLGYICGWCYSIPPIKASYYGWGEILQSICLSLVLPSYSYYFKVGDLYNFPTFKLLELAPIYFASNIVHSIPDYLSDKESNRLTLAVIFGVPIAKYIVVFSYLLSSLLMSFNCFDNYIILIHSLVSIVILYISGSFSSESNSIKNFVRCNLLAGPTHIFIWIYLNFFNK